MVYSHVCDDLYQNLRMGCDGRMDGRTDKIAQVIAVTLCLCFVARVNYHVWNKKVKKSKTSVVI